MLTDAELAARIGRITSSTVAMARGYSPYGGPYTAKQLILGRLHIERTPRMALGDMCEPALLGDVAQTFDWDWESPGFVAHGDGWAGDSADAVFFDKNTGEAIALGEAKTTSRTDHWGQPGTSQVPDYVTLQCCWHLYHHPTIDQVMVPVLMGSHGGLSHAIYRIERNDQLIHRVVEEMRQWHQRYILADEDPTPDDRDLPTLKERYPKALQNDPVPMPAEVEILALEKIRLREARLMLEKQEKTLEAQLRAAVGDAAYMRSEHVYVTCKNATLRKTVDWQQLCTDLLQPTDAQIAQYTREIAVQRTLSVTEPKIRKASL